MSWAVSVFENGKLYQRIQYKDKNKALNMVVVSAMKWN